MELELGDKCELEFGEKLLGTRVRGKLLEIKVKLSPKRECGGSITVKNALTH